MPAQPYTMYAQWEAKTPATITFFAHGTTYDTKNSYVGDTFGSVFDEVTDPENNNAYFSGYTFRGWSTSDSESSPAIVEDATTISESCTLYAIFGKSSSSYNLVESSLSDWRGDYLIAYNDDVFMDGSLDGGTDGVGKANSSVAPGDALSSDKKTITTAWGDTHYVTLEAIDDNNLSSGYVIKSHSSTTPYFYQTSNKNGMACTANKSTAASYPITVTFNSSSDIDLALGGNAEGAVLHYNPDTNNGQMFRFYKNGGQENIYLYKKNVAAPVYSLEIVPALVNVSLATIGEKAYATRYFDYEVTVNEDVKAYKGKVVDGAVILTEVKNTIPANSAVMLVANTANTYSFEVAATPTAEALEDNEFFGYTVDTQVTKEDGHTYLALNKNDKDQAGFFAPKGSVGNDNWTAKAYKAYIDTEYEFDGTEAKGIGFVFDEETSISEVAVSKEQVVGGIFNLAGQKISAPVKGQIYIVNGKKVMF